MVAEFGLIYGENDFLVCLQGNFFCRCIHIGKEAVSSEKGDSYDNDTAYVFST